MHCACSCTESEQWWDDAKGVWQKVVFPSKRPANRAQVVMLEKWMTSALAAAATKHEKHIHHCTNMNPKGRSTAVTAVHA
eukprot:12944-Heterococcus_DN1.PRE.1